MAAPYPHRRERAGDPVIGAEVPDSGEQITFGHHDDGDDRDSGRHAPPQQRYAVGVAAFPQTQKWQQDQRLGQPLGQP